MITFVQLGNVLHRVPKIGTLVQHPLAAPNRLSLYSSQVMAVNAVTTEYFSLLDGYEDRLLDGFEIAMTYLCNQLTATGLHLGTARERENGKMGKLLHHGVVCRTSAYRQLNIPPTGIFRFEAIVYPLLAHTRFIIYDNVAYDWVFTGNGASTWHDTVAANNNSKKFVQQQLFHTRA